MAPRRRFSMFAIHFDMDSKINMNDSLHMNDKPSSRIFFATFVEPNKKHFLDLNAFANKQADNAISDNEVIIRYFSIQGGLIATDKIVDPSALHLLRADFQSSCLVMIDAPFRKTIPSIYGYSVGRDDQGGVFYPLDTAIGYPETQTWFNKGVVPVGSQSAGTKLALFLANASRWARLHIRVLFHGDGQTVDVRTSLKPKCHMFMHVEETAAQHGFIGQVEAISVVSNNKPIVYILGRSNETGDLGFIEHLMAVYRSEIQLPDVKRPQIGPELETDFLETIVCWCKGVKTRQVIDGKIPAQSGNYCTACRDDLRLLSRTIKQEPELVNHLDRLQVILNNSVDKDS